MKMLLHLTFFLTFTLPITAQTQPRPNRSINAYVGLWQIGAANRGNNAPGIQHRIRQSPFILGLDFTQHWHKRWHYFASLQASMHYVSNITGFPTSLPNGVVNFELAHDDFVAWQMMAGGGLQYYLMERKEYSLRLSAGMFGAYTPNREVQGEGIYLLNASGDDTELAGTVQHRVSRQWIPVGRLGIGGQYRPLFAKRFAVGAELFYYRSTDFMQGSWMRTFSGSTEVATSGMYQAGLNNLILSLQATYLF